MVDRIGEIIVGALGEKLSDQEKTAVKIAFNNMQRTSDRVGGRVAKLDHIEVSDGRFSVLPLKAVELRRITTQSIPDAATTAISFSEAVRGKGSVFRWDAADPTKIYFTEQGYKIMAVVGKTEWPANATGYRNVHMATYDSDDVLQFGGTMCNLSPVESGIGTTIPFATVYSNMSADFNMSVNVVQESGGGALNLNFASIGLFLIK